MRATILLFSAIFWATVAGQASPLLTIFPPGSSVAAGDLTVAPGAATGWGFTIINPDDDFIVITGSSFCLGTSDGINNACIPPALGTYTDFIGPQFDVIGPSPENATLHQDFDAGTSMGVGSYAANVNATPGLSDAGQLVVTYDVYAQDPNVTFTDPIATSQLLTAAASVTIESASAVPEPSTAFLLLVAGALFTCSRFLRPRAHPLS